jgi:hypothetical protein
MPKSVRTQRSGLSNEATRRVLRQFQHTCARRNGLAWRISGLRLRPRIFTGAIWWGQQERFEGAYTDSFLQSAKILGNIGVTIGQYGTH